MFDWWCTEDEEEEEEEEQVNLFFLEFMYITLGLRQNGHHFADDILKCIFLSENVWIFIKISLKFVPKGPINDIPVLVQIMAWRWPGNKPLYESMMVRLQTYMRHCNTCETIHLLLCL